MDFLLVIDKRERDIISLLDSNKTYYDANNKIIRWEIQHLTIGDYIIFQGNQAIIVIERKTWKDLAASFRDGRKENINKLKKYNQETNAKICYLIEGIPIPSKNSKFGRIPYKNLRSHLDHLLVRDNIIELHTANHHGTIERIFEFIRNISSISNKEQSKKNLEFNNTELKHIELAQTPIKKSDQEIIDKIWCCIPGISTISVKLFRKYNIYNLLIGNITEQEISNLTYQNGRTIGNKKAKTIFNISNLSNSNNDTYYINILSAIPGISKITSKKILQEFTMENIINSWNDIKPKLINFKCEKNCIGEKKINNIEKFLIN
jgi:ERCC4-type nuclease